MDHSAIMALCELLGENSRVNPLRSSLTVPDVEVAGSKIETYLIDPRVSGIC